MLFIANWKMHGSMDFLSQWAAQFQPPPDVKTIVCPPAPYLAAARKILPPTTAIGAQNISIHPQDGAHTGEVSARMLADCGGEYALIGHSERRRQGETNDECGLKIIAAAAHNITPVLCIGESADERDSGKTTATLAAQLNIIPAKPPRMIIAYEPVWAIGSGITPSVDALNLAGKTIRQQLIAQMGGFSDIISLLYGGSIGADNAALPRHAGMDGGLIGGASLDAGVFAQICRNSIAK